MKTQNSISRARPGAGYTLVEVLVGSLLVAAVAIAVFQVFSQGSTINRKEITRRRAYQDLERILERPKYSYRGGNYTSTDLAVGTRPDTTVTLDSSRTPPLTGTMSVRIDTTTYTYSGTTIPSKKVTAKLTWTDNGVASSESLQTIITLVDVN
jgi:hypothetical protein